MLPFKCIFVNQTGGQEPLDRRHSQCQRALKPVPDRTSTQKAKKSRFEKIIFIYSFLEEQLESAETFKMFSRVQQRKAEEGTAIGYFLSESHILHNTTRGLCFYMCIVSASLRRLQ